jgi:hypothetical protein
VGLRGNDLDIGQELVDRRCDRLEVGVLGTPNRQRHGRTSEGPAMTSAPEWTYRHATELRNHWWWRPGWHVGTRFYAWHITLDDGPEIYPLVEFWREQLRAFEYLDPIPDRWLHLTMQGVGMVEGVPDQTRDRIVTAVRQRLGELEPPRVTFQRPLVRRPSSSPRFHRTRWTPFGEPSVRGWPTSSVPAPYPRVRTGSSPM